MRAWFLCGLAMTCCEGVREAAPAPASAPREGTQTHLASVATPADDGPLRFETFQPTSGPPTFVVRGGKPGPGRLVFLHGMCGHGLGYAQAFPRAAAERGTLIAPQGDVSCGGPWSKWSGNIQELDRRIEEAFSFAGHAPPLREVWLIGLSQGATRAAELAKKWPERYTHLVGIAAPTALRPGQLNSLSAAVMMAGDRDRRDLMQQSQRALQAGGVPALFLVMPDAPHGSLGREPEITMGRALAYLAEHPRR